jgi:hypothetical protein
MAIMDSSLPNRPLSERAFDELRGLYVTATPEEQVRQGVLHKMVYTLDYPKTLIVIEKELKELPHLAHTAPPHRRIDILCYGKNIHPEHTLYPLLLIECKAHAIDTAAKEQLIGYNSHVGAYFIALAAPSEVQFGYLDKKTARLVFHAGLPSYQELLAWIR